MIFHFVLVWLSSAKEQSISLIYFSPKYSLVLPISAYKKINYNKCKLGYDSDMSRWKLKVMEDRND